MLEATQSATTHRSLWTISEQDSESIASTQSSYRSTQTHLPDAERAQCFTSAQNVAVHRPSLRMDLHTCPLADAHPFETTAGTIRASTRLSHPLIAVGKFSAWTRFRTTLIACSPKLLQYRLRTVPSGNAQEEANIAAVLLKTIAVLATANVQKLGNVNAVFTRDETWLCDNLQAINAMFDTLAERQGYARKSHTSAKRYLYESAAGALKHLTAIDEDQKMVEQQTLRFQTERMQETD